MLAKFRRPAELPEKTMPAAPRKSTAIGPPSSLPSIIGQGLTFEGNVTGEGDLYIEGELLGDVVVSNLSIGETGCAKGTITAASIEVRGAVIGSISAKIVRLAATCHVEGDISHDQLELESGAWFEGRCMKLRTTPAAEAPKPVEEPSVVEPKAVVEPKPVKESGPVEGSELEFEEAAAD
jgi:cytoskeletal protein CcmA (bactofilin family)